MNSLVTRLEHKDSNLRSWTHVYCYKCKDFVDI